MCPPGPPGSESFPKSRRLRKRVEYQTVYEQGLRLRCACFALFCRRTGTAEPGRVGLTVPKQVGGSVVRSRVKRRLRELIRRHWADIPEGYEAVLHAYGAIVRTSARELEDQLARAFKDSTRALESGRGRSVEQGRQQKGS